MNKFLTLLFIMFPTYVLAEEKPAVDKIVDFAISKISDAIGAAQSAMPKATELALGVVRVSALENIITSLVILFISSGGGYIGWRLISYENTRKKDGYDMPVYGIFGTVGSIICLVAGIASIVILVNVWNWISLFHPELGLAHQVLQNLVK